MAKYEISDDDWLRVMRALRAQRDSLTVLVANVRTATATGDPAVRAVEAEESAIRRLLSDLTNQAVADEVAERKAAPPR